MTQNRLVLLVGMTLTLLLLLFPMPVHCQLKGLEGRSLPKNFTQLFCKTQPPQKKPIGYRHPYFCSKMIICSPIIKSGETIQDSEEQSCPPCQNTSTKGQAITSDDIKECPYGHQFYDEEKQVCVEPKSITNPCRQKELPTQNVVWGDDHNLVSVCGEESGFFNHPTHCNKYVFCERDIRYEDIYVEEMSCPACEKDEKNCPTGFYQHTGNGTCVLPEEGKLKICDDKNILLTTTPKPTSQPNKTGPRKNNLDSKEIIPTMEGNVTDFAIEFCSKQSKEPMRYTHPEMCEKYIHCWYGLYDKDGVKDRNKAKHLELYCNYCDQNPYWCPSGRLYFDPEEEECVTPQSYQCTKVPKDSIIPAIPEEEKPILTKEEVLQFCSQKKNISGDYSHPKDKSCRRYITCWFELGYMTEKTCEKCEKDDLKECPGGYQYFNDAKGVCQLPKDSSCKPNEAAKKLVGLPPVIDSITGNMTTTPSQSLFKPRPCSTKQYIQRGYCKTYFSCDRKTHMEVEHKCTGRLLWNPEHNTIHGGVCDKHKNINEFTLYQYQKDPGCVLSTAYFRPETKECSASYFYNHPALTLGKEIRLKCPEDLLFNKQKETCVLCTEEFDSKKNKCCEFADDD